MSEDKLCPKCGGYKKPDFENCWNCHQNELREQNRLCACGKIKRAEFEECRDCGLRKRNRQPYEKQTM